MSPKPSKSQYATKSEINSARDTLVQTFKTGRTKDLRWRKWQLKQLWWLIVDNEDQIISALSEDLGRHELESHLTDLSAIKSDILLHIKNLESWAADEKPDAGFIFGTLGKARVRNEPRGVALIIGTWNFPLVVCLCPLVAAIAAGNCVLLKPSEVAESCERLLADLIPKYLDPEAVRCVTGAVQETTYILTLQFDHIFFTGSASIGRHVAAAAAKNLTPVVLELGGQAPAVVTANADVDLAAKRIASAKYLNAGQICLSVNHVFVDPSVHKEFVTRVRYWNGKFEGKDGAAAKGEEKEGESQMTKIVSPRHFERLTKLLQGTKGDVVYGGNGSLDKLSFRPTVIDNVEMSDSLLSEELFGPLLPIVKADYRTACKILQDMPHPLAIYIFSRKKEEVDYVLNNTLTGGATINDTLMHAAVPNAPFGGVGESGYGAYHGKYGFDAFSHKRTVVRPPTWMESLLALRYPPFDIRNKGKIAVKNTLGFKRGEGLTDQRINGTGIGVNGWVKGVGLGFVVMWVVDSWVLGGGIGVGDAMAGVLSRK